MTVALAGRPRRSVESHAHRQAKALLAKWLREAAAAVGRDGHADFAGLSWRVNRGGPHYGVWQEYPILDDGIGLSPVWDETHERWHSSPPSFDDITATGECPACVIDIAVQHKGDIAYAIEVVHKHRCDDRKIAFLTQRLTLLEIPAYWVLGQVDRPTEIPAEFYL